MPRYDGTGPDGQGSMTGRGLGPCERGLGKSRGMGRGLGRGLGRGYGFRQAQPITEAQEKSYLQEQLQVIEDTKEGIEKRLTELK